MHDKFNGDIKEAKILKGRPKEIPVDIIKSFLQIKLKNCMPFLLFRSSQAMDNFLQNNGIIRSSHIWQKTALVGSNNSIKNLS